MTQGLAARADRISACHGRGCHRGLVGKSEEGRKERGLLPFRESLWAVCDRLERGGAGNSGFIMVGCVGLGYLLGPPAFALPIGVFVGDWTYWTFFARHVHEATARETKTVPERIAQAVEKDSRSALRKVASLILLLCMSVYAAAQLTPPASP